MKRNLTLGIVAAIGIVIAALYGMQAREGNVEAENSCAANTDFINGTIAGLATGEVAAFQIPRQPQSLSDLAFLDADGKAATLADFSDKVLLVNLWATWCAPCRREMPALDRLQVELGGDGSFAVVPVNIDTGSVAKAQAFLDSIKVSNLPLYSDPTTDIFQDVKKRGLGLGLPVSMLVDKTGCLLGHLAGPAEWDSEDAKALISAAIQR
jgi:thiol-disulfide isomerase/thioredoxin